MARQKVLFQSLQQFIKDDDHTSIDHLLKWEYQKSRLFQMKNDDGLTIVHIACLEGKLKCIDVLLMHGGSAQVTSSVGWTPLHAATLGGKIDTVHYLLRDCSADPLAVDDMGCLASELTMDPHILNLIKTYVDALKLKREREDIETKKASDIAAKKERRYSTNLEQSKRKEKHMGRVRSVVVTQAEARSIRSRLRVGLEKANDETKLTNATSTSNIQVNLPTENYTNDTCDIGLLSPPTREVSSRNNLCYNSLPRDGSSRYRRFTEDRSSQNDTRLKVEDLRRRLSSSSLSGSSSPRVSYFRDGSRRSRESKNRDSGVFEEDLETAAVEQKDTTEMGDFAPPEYYKYV